MKWLVALGIVQTVLLTALLVAVNRRNADSVATNPHIAATGSVRSQSAERIVLSIEEDRLRKIVRDELSKVAAKDVDSRASAETRRNAKSTTVADSESVQVQARRQKRELVAQHIEYYKSLGAISDRQMEELQTEIERLDAQDREQMLSVLIKALNAGIIKGQLQ